MYLLDTDHLGVIQRRAAPAYGLLSTRMAAHDSAEFFISIVSFHEQVAGWNVYISQARDGAGVLRAYKMMEQILVDFAASQVVSFDAAALEIFQNLRSLKIRVATMDLRIASIAIRSDFVLLSRNLADFRKVPGLRVEDWCS